MRVTGKVSKEESRIKWKNDVEIARMGLREERRD